MRIQYRVLAIACFAIAAKADAQKVARSFDAKRGEIIAELKAEAARLERGSISDVFADLGNPGEIGRLRLSAEQADLARRLDEAARAVVRAWLLRGLDSGTPPSTAELAERLGEPGGRLRNAVAAHSEAVAREAVLTRHQNRKTRTASGSAAGVLPGRYGLLPSLNDKPPQTAVDFNSMIRGMAAGLKNPKIPASELFGILTAGAKGPPGLSTEQLQLVRALDELARTVCRGWVLRGLGNPPPKGEDPPAQDLVDRLSDRGKQLHASVVAHGELIALEAVLSPDQAEWARREFWRRRGVLSLLDPELAARLKLSRLQREEVFDRIVRRSQVAVEATSAALNSSVESDLAKIYGAPDQANRAARAAADREGAGLTIAEADSSVTDALTPGQARLYFRLVAKPGPDRPAAKSKKRSRSS